MKHRAQRRFNLRGALLIFLAGCIFISLAFRLITYPSTHLRYPQKRPFLTVAVQ